MSSSRWLPTSNASGESGGMASPGMGVSGTVRRSEAAGRRRGAALRRRRGAVAQASEHPVHRVVPEPVAAAAHHDDIGVVDVDDRNAGEIIVGIAVTQHEHMRARVVGSEVRCGRGHRRHVSRRRGQDFLGRAQLACLDQRLSGKHVGEQRCDPPRQHFGHRRPGALERNVLKVDAGPPLFR